MKLTAYKQFSYSPTAIIFPTKFLCIYSLDKFVYLDPKFIWSYLIMVCCVQGVFNLTNKDGELIDARDKLWQLIKKKLEGNLRKILIVTRWVNLLSSFLNTQMLHMFMCVCMYVCMYVVR
jgi:hypothetical protein